MGMIGRLEMRNRKELEHEANQHQLQGFTTITEILLDIRDLLLIEHDQRVKAEKKLVKATIFPLKHNLPKQ